MAVAVDVVGTNFDNTSGVTTLSSSTSITVGASATALVVLVGASNTGVSHATGMTATWNSVSMTLLASINYDTNGAQNNGTVWVFGLRNPASGAKTLSISWTNAQDATACAISFTGSDTSSDANAFPTANRVTNSGTTGNLSLTVNSATGNFTVAIGGSASVTTPNQTQIFLDTACPDDVLAQRATGTASVSYTWTGSTVKWGTAGIDIAAASSGLTLGTQTLVMM